MERVNKPQISGISIVSFIIVVAISLTYYQFVYMPTLSAKPIVSEEILNPAQPIQASIASGSSQPSQTDNFEPKEIIGKLGTSNKIVWTNNDVVPHTVTTDTDYEDPTNGRFDTMPTIGIIPPGGTFEFTFTEEGEYLYHCEPHPWMTGKVSIQKDFS